MAIEITRPESEALIQQRLQSGAFTDAEDVILQALQSFAPEPAQAFDRERALAAGARIRAAARRNSVTDDLALRRVAASNYDCNSSVLRSPCCFPVGRGYSDSAFRLPLRFHFCQLRSPRPAPAQMRQPAFRLVLNIEHWALDSDSLNQSPTQSAKLFAPAMVSQHHGRGSFQCFAPAFLVMPPLKISVSRARVMAT